MGGCCKERYNKDQNSKLEGLHQKPDRREETRWEGQNFSEVVAPQEEEEEEEEDTTNTAVMNLHVFFWTVLSIDA
jgi:hypothetical protein